MQKLVICAAITGSAPARTRSIHHPLTPAAIAREACLAWQAGAAIVHCHARTEDGLSTNALPAYRDLLARIRDLGCEAVINFSAGDNGGASGHEERLSVIEAGADIVSLGGGSFNVGDRLYDNRPEFRLRMAQKMKDAGVVPECEIFDLGQITGIWALQSRGLVPDAPLVTLVTGIPGGLPAEPDVIRTAAGLLPADCHWSLCCQTDTASTHQRLQMTAYTLGGHIRVGMEDCPYIADGIAAKSNAELVHQWARMAETWHRELASAADVRRLLLAA